MIHRFKIIVLVALLSLIFRGKLYTQPPCDPPLIAAVSATGPVCAGGTILITFDIDDDDDDVTILYSIDGVIYNIQNAGDDVVIEYAAGSSTVLTLISVEAEDDGCITQINQSIPLLVSQPAGNLIVTEPGCGQSNGVIQVQTTGGTEPFSFSLNGGPFQSSPVFSGLAAGNYTVDILDGAGCSGLASAILSAPGAPVLSVNNLSQPACGTADGSIDVGATGGTPPYTYSLNGGPAQPSGVFEALGPGTYTVTTLDDAGCGAEITVMLSSPGAPVLSVSNVSNPGCGLTNGSITVAATGGAPPFTYSLNGGPSQSSGVFSGLATGNYTINTLDGAGCSSSVTATLSSPGVPVLSAANVNAPECGLPDGSFSISTTGGTAPFFFSLNGSPFQASGNYSGLTAGVYTVEVRDGAGCTSTVTVTFDAPLLPQAQTDGIFNTTDGQTLEINILQNDQIPAPVTVTIIRNPSQGSVQTDDNGNLEYLPDAGAAGNDTAVYQICYTDCPDICDTAMIFFRNNGNENPCFISGDTSNVFTNGLTPNGDGLNDVLVFRLVSVEECAVNHATSEIIIYNRWGDIVFEASPYNNKWGGENRNGKQLPPGVYYFALRIKPDNKVYTQFGSVILIR